MVDMRRPDLEPTPTRPKIQFKPGLADEMLRELAPLLAEEGIDVDNIDVPDMETLQNVLNRAVERHNIARFTPVGQARELAVVTLRLVVEAIAESNTSLAAEILDQVQPESPDNSTRDSICVHRRRARTAGPMAARARSRCPSQPRSPDSVAGRPLGRRTRRH